MQTRFGVKEWSAVVEAIGKGQQAVLIRRYKPLDKTLFLYPTFSFYAANQLKPEKLTEMFQTKYLDLASNAGHDTMTRAKTDFLVDITHFVLVEHVLMAPIDFNWESLQDFFIWTPQHVESYAAGSKANSIYIWLVRAFRLIQPFSIGRLSQGGPPAFYTHHEQIQLEPNTPVFDSKSFTKVRDGLLKVVNRQ